jgi:general secretion pathway protein H
LLAPRAHLTRRDAGMTLVEVMMVIFIIGLATTVAVMTLPPRERPEARVLREVETALMQAQDRAVLTGEVIGLQQTEAGFELLSWTGEEWLPLQGGTLRLPDGVDVEILPPDDQRRTGQAAPERIVFNPLGRAEPVTLAVSWQGWSERVELNPDGEVANDADL